LKFRFLIDCNANTTRSITTDYFNIVVEFCQ